jgi:dihydroxy-acid dehydratase
MPGAMIAIARLNRPAMLVYGGTIRSGEYKGQKLDIVSAFEALGKKFAGNISDEDYEGVIRNAIPGAGACGGMYTANTMASSMEAMGLTWPLPMQRMLILHLMIYKLSPTVFRFWLI